MNRVDDGSGVVELYSGDKRQGRERERENPCTVVLYIFIVVSVCKIPLQYVQIESYIAAIKGMKTVTVRSTHDYKSISGTCKHK